MATDSSPELTQLLLAWNEGDATALEKLIPLVYAELRRLAQNYMARESPGHTLQATALVNEAYLRLIEQHRVRWQNRAHFFGISAQLMRRILMDYARRSHALKRGEAGLKVSLAEATEVADERGVDFLALDDALESLAEIDRRKSQIVELRFFGGLSVEETAEVMQLSPRTVLREWSLAQAWLHRELQEK